MNVETINLSGGRGAQGFTVELGPVNLVFVKTDTGMIGCGAFNVMALDKFEYPAARIASEDGSPIRCPDDLLEGVVIEVNKTAAGKGAALELKGRDVLEML
ncbi:hypothetical protein SMSP2_02935 [Limihaloglobus sulfuriphilus]|uniref:DUF1805 domain-containing protein n=1 Tax=Limihaloglobus sulfuriphilus TaxID=1851148 RepID=A0A1Q2MIK3_9BACT|nr:DUF1805 domain-containing protein [Limihaloglobus sulfuriphilus]AQQ72545.1 hypothetical protein SMSP2_02935 [Limihaloglobus sulfuriphilus]